MARFKVISLLKAREDISREAFIDYYETHHAPLVLELMPNIVDYRRNYVQPGEGFVFPEAPDFIYDSITEIWFDDRATYNEAIAVLLSPENAARLAEDEARFLDSSKTRMVMVDERTTAF